MKWTFKTQYVPSLFYVLPSVSLIVSKSNYSYKFQAVSLNFNWLNYHLNLLFYRELL